MSNILYVQPDFFDKFILVVVDKGLLVGLALVVGLWVNRVLESFKTQQATLLETFKGQQAVSLETFRSERSLENEIAKLRETKQIEFLERQLSQFYWPIYMRLQIDNAVWEKILDKRNGEDDLRRRIGAEIEKTLILPNHEEIVRTMESNMHLAVPDVKAFQAMLQYIRHVAVYKAMRAAECTDKDPIHLGEPWPDNLFPLVKKNVEGLQSLYADLINSARVKEAGSNSETASDHQRVLRQKADEYLQIRVRGFSKSVNALNELANELGDYIVGHGLPRDALVQSLESEPHDGLLVALASAMKSHPQVGDTKRLIAIACKTQKRHVRYRIVEAFGELYKAKVATLADNKSVYRILDLYEKEDRDEPLLKQISVCREVMERLTS